MWFPFCNVAIFPWRGRHGYAEYSFRQHANQMPVFMAALVGLVDLDSMLPTHIWVFTEYSFRQHANQMHVFMAPWWVLWTWTACYLLTSGCSWQATEAISYCHEKGVMHKERLLKASSFSCRKLAPCRKSPAPQLLVLSAGSEVREPSLAAACLLQVDVSVCIN